MRATRREGCPVRNPEAYRLYLIFSGATAFFFALAYSVATVYRVEAAGLSPLQLVLVGTTLEVTYFLFNVPTGVVADTYSRRLSVIIGVFLWGLGLAVEGRSEERRVGKECRSRWSPYH